MEKFIMPDRDYVVAPGENDPIGFGYEIGAYRPYDYSDGLHRMALSINVLVDVYRAGELVIDHPALLSYKSELLIPGYPHFRSEGTWACYAVEAMSGSDDPCNGPCNEAYMDAWDIYHGYPAGSWR